MARIQLRDTFMYLQDGLSGTALVNEVTGALASPSATTTTPGVPATTNEVQAIEAYAVNFTGGTFTLTFDLNVATGDFTTAPIAFNASAGTVETAIDVAATLAGVTGWTNGDITVSGGPLTSGDLVLTFDGTSVDQLDHGQTTINGALLTSSALTGATDIDLDNVSLNTTDTDLVPVGARFTIAGETNSPIHTVTGRTGNPTTNVAFEPAIAGAGVLNNATITFLPQRVELKIGEGDFSWTESRELVYDRNRDLLDTVRLGQEQPLEISSAFILEYIATQSGQPVTPTDALKREGAAAEWVSSSDDLCEPYAVDIYIVHCLSCGDAEDQAFLFQDFRWETLDYSIQDATVTMSGSCNVSSVVASRGTLGECA